MMAKAHTHPASDRSNKCGICGREAFTPDRFTDADRQQLDGVFNVCGTCGAECSGTGAYTEKYRWHWTDAKTVARGRAALEAAELDADWAESQRCDY